MAAISKIRVVNLHYDNQKKCHEDTKFNFLADNGVPTHGAITFPNGHGKGALIQAINQVFLPETKWGKKNENTVLHYFMKNDKFHPFTFYVVIEWWLSLTNRLMTGIAMTAEEDSELSNGNGYRIKYRLFGKKYKKNQFDINDLPIWDEEKKTTKKLSEFEIYCKENKDIFHYAPSGKRNFFKECRTHGIYESDWADLKKINKKEAGISPYFEEKNATKNETLFRNMLIPSIVEKQKSIDDIDIQKELSQQFKDSASIAINLPYLLAREKYHQEILNIGNQFDTHISEYEFANKEINEQKRSGENILANLDAMIENITNQIKEIENEIDVLKIQEDENKWKKSNLKYVEKSRDLKEKKEELNSVINLKIKAVEFKQQAEEKKQESEKRVLVKEYHTKEKQLKQVQDELHSLEQSPEIKQLSIQEDALKQKIIEEWIFVERQLNEIQKSYYGFSNKKTEELNEARKKDGQYSSDKGKLSQKIEQLTNQKNDFESTLEVAKQRFGFSVHSKPEIIKSEITEEINNLKNELILKENNEQLLNNQKDSLLSALGVLSGQISNLEENRISLDSEISTQQNKQYKWMNQAAKLLRLSTEDCEANFNWLHSKIPDLQNLKERRLNTQKEFSLTLLKIEQQLQISTIDELVLNTDIQKISNKLNQAGVYHEIGTKFLATRNEQERKIYNSRFPYLKYSIIVQVPNIADLKKRVNFTDDLHQSSVNIISHTILENSNLEGLDNNILIFKNQADEFVETPSGWRDFFEKSINEKEKIENEISTIEDEIEEIADLLSSLNRFKESESSEKLTETLRILESNLDRHKQDSDLKKQEFNSLKTKIDENKTAQKKLAQDIQNKTTDLNDLDTFIRRLDEHKNDTSELKNAESKLIEIKQMQSDLKTSIDDLQSELDSWQSAYVNWKARCNQAIKDIKNIEGNIDFPIETKAFKADGKLEHPVLQDSLFDSILLVVKQHNDLRASIEEKSAKIAVLNSDKKRFTDDLDVTRKELLALDEKGLSIQEPTEHIEVLKSQKEKAIIALNEAINSLQKYEVKLAGLNSAVNVIENQVNDFIKEIKENHGREVEDWTDEEDLPVLSLEIDNEREKIKASIEEKKALVKRNQDEKLLLEKVRPQITAKLEVDFGAVFSIQENIIPQIEGKINEYVSEWSTEFDKRKRRKKEAFTTIQRIQKRSIETIKFSTWDETLRDEVLECYTSMEINNVNSIKETIQGIKISSTHALESLESDKLKGIEARGRWVKYAAQFSSNIVKAVFEMTDSLVVKNRGGFDFPLVKIKNKRKLSSNPDDYIITLENFFDSAIEKANGKGVAINSLTLQEISDIINIGDIVFSALSNQYPLFDIYNLGIDNSFIYDTSRPEHYVDWQVLNEASVTRASGSGGQVLSASTIMFIMMTSYKKRLSEKNNEWQFIYMDNPLANAVSSNVLDPIFALTEVLNYQFIVIAPPELMKSELTMKFPSMNDLSFKKLPNGKDKVCVGKRQFTNPTKFMSEEFETEVMGFSVVKNTDIEQGEFIFD